jgi:uncharacterized protein (DUF58 family)
VTSKPDRERSLYRIRLTRPFFVYCMVLLGFFYAGMSQSNAVAYLLLFLLVSLGLVSIPAGFRNVRNISAKLRSGAAGFGDETLVIQVSLLNRSTKPAWGVEVLLPHLPASTQLSAEAVSVGPKDQVTADISGRLPRGVHPVHYVLLTSDYPLGLFRWNRLEPVAGTVVVYPERRGDLPLPSTDPGGVESGNAVKQTAGDDFRGWRKSLPGDSSRHIDWKAVARGHPRMVKQFEGSATQTVTLSYSAMRLREPEDRLAQLARWIWECHLRRISYALELPGLHMPAASSPEHNRQALEALARFSP